MSGWEAGRTEGRERGKGSEAGSKDGSEGARDRERGQGEEDFDESVCLREEGSGRGREKVHERGQIRGILSVHASPGASQP